MTTSINKILILGKSDKFTNIVYKLFSHAEILVISWRECINYVDLSKNFLPDLIVVCGYDYASSHYNFKRYFDVNVLQPYQVICTISKLSTKIIYIDTYHGRNQFTFSRYQFAKKMLGVKVSARFNDSFILSIPTILNNTGGADIRGGLLTKLIFNFFVRIGFVRTITLDELELFFLDSLERENHLNFDILTPKFLHIRRTLFIDRLLRFFGG